MALTTGEADIKALARAYYTALESGDDLAPFYATDEETGGLGPVSKIGSGAGEVFTDAHEVAAEVARVAATFVQNRLESRGLVARVRGDIGWFTDLVWWAGEEGGRPFASLTRWTGVCQLTPRGWRLLHLHVSEGVADAYASTPSPQQES